MEEMEPSGKGAGTTGVLLPRCHLCGNVPEKGIRGGVKIKRVFICEQCEQQIVTLQIGTDNYQYLIEELKKIW